MDEQLLTIPEVCKRLGIGKSRIYVWIRQGRLKTVETKTRYGKEGTKERIVYRVPLSQCIIPKAVKPGPKPPDIPRLTIPPSKYPRNKKKKRIQRRQQTDLE